MTRFIFDFPDSSGAAQRRIFANPREFIYATSVHEVEPALRRVEALCARGAWAAGYVSYEAAPAFDVAMHVLSSASMPLLQFGICDVCDVDSSAPHASTANARMQWHETTTAARFVAYVARIRDAIAAGETYQVNYTTRLSSLLEGDAYALYESMRAAQGGGWHAYLELAGHTIVSASPELFFQKRGPVVTTRPMKGTRPRGRWRAEDQALARELQASPKDRAENLMIVDLLRNDIGRIAETGSVSVTGLYDLEAYETVWQLTSTITGATRTDVGLYDIFAALFPCGSVTGAPKINTMKWIADLEGSPRDVYCGAIGIVEPGGDCTFSVPIRTVWIDNATRACTYGVGAGITIDSDPEEELAEVRAKSQVLQATPVSFQLIETMRFENDSLVRVGRHMARLAESAAFLGFGLSRDEIEDTCVSACMRACRDANKLTARVRLLLDRDGKCNVAVADAPHHYATRDASRSAGALQHVTLAREPVSSRDRFLCHKTTNRGVYESRRDPLAFDTLLWNENHEVTEFTIGNVVLEIDGALMTPLRTSGLLNGVFRQQLLDEGVITEAVLRVPDLEYASRMWLINSVREWVEVELVSGDTGRQPDR